eukprot:2376602-Amphidinium_carterae.1
MAGKLCQEEIYMAISWANADTALCQLEPKAILLWHIAETRSERSRFGVKTLDPKTTLWARTRAHQDQLALSKLSCADAAGQGATLRAKSFPIASALCLRHEFVHLKALGHYECKLSCTLPGNSLVSIRSFCSYLFAFLIGNETNT